MLPVQHRQQFQVLTVDYMQSFQFHSWSSRAVLSRTWYEDKLLFLLSNAVLGFQAFTRLLMGGDCFLMCGV